jgi:hypothetical protein
MNQTTLDALRNKVSRGEQLQHEASNLARDVKSLRSLGNGELGMKFNCFVADHFRGYHAGFSDELRLILCVAIDARLAQCKADFERL